MFYSTEAIVLTNRPYGEADLIVTYLTREFGIVDLFAKSPRKIGSRFGSSFEFFTYSKITFTGKHERLQRIIQSVIIRPFQEIRENYRLFLKISDMLNLLLKLIPHRVKHEELFEIFLETLRRVSDSPRQDNYILYFLINGLKISGYLPELKSCGVCRRVLNGDNYYSRGFILCRSCLSEESPNDGTEREQTIFQVPRGVLRLIDTLSSWRIEQIERIIINENLSEQVERFIRNHVFQVLER